jgi:uncharacterized protein YndB with AHSA1/START domain
MRTLDDAELGTIERELYIDAAPEVVFDVISRPEHVAEWWPDTATYAVLPGSSGTLVFGDPDADGKVVRLTVLEVERPKIFSFRWAHAESEEAVPGNSLLVTFELVPSGQGTQVRFVETGFREQAWEAAEYQANYSDHVNGWNYFLPRLAPYAESVGRST